MHTRDPNDNPFFPGPADIRNCVLSSAILAPSPHNTQPWKIKLERTERILISIDRDRLIPGCDPIGRQTFISTGAFLENLDITAGSLGYRADLDLFPEGWPDPRTVPDTPIARIDLVRDGRCIPDPLSTQIPIRHTNRRVFSTREVSLHSTGQITESYEYSLVPFGFSNDRDFIRTIAGFAADAMDIELADKTRRNETLQYFRFTDEEVLKSADGIGLAQSGYGRISRFLIGKFFLSRKKATASPSLFSGMATKKTRAQVEGSGGIGWLSTKSDHRVDQVRAGRAFQRIHLKATSLGIALQPITQPLADYGEMSDLRSALYEYLGIPDTHTVQMLFRLGYAPTVPPSPRRNLQMFLKL